MRNKNMLIWLNEIGVTNNGISVLLEKFDDLEEILYIDRKTLKKLPSLHISQANKIINNRNNYNIDDILENLYRNNIDLLTIYDENYPKRLDNIYDKPYVLYLRGNYLPKTDEKSIAIVGSRKSTAYGQWACKEIVRDLTDLGFTIISGLALGIDKVAHTISVEKNARTIGVLGNSLDYIYPKGNSKLYREIPENGCLISEFPLGTKPLSYNFPKRNRIIAGLSLGVIVIEARIKSGSLITAHHAMEQGKDVFSLPGNINSIYSEGTNHLIRDGAIPLLGIDTILNELDMIEDNEKIEKKEDLDYDLFSPLEVKILELLKEGPYHVDSIAHKTNLEIATVISILTILELKNVVMEDTSRTYMLS